MRHSSACAPPPTGRLDANATPRASRSLASASGFPRQIFRTMAASSFRSPPIEKAISPIPCETCFPRLPTPLDCVLAFAGSTRRMSPWRNLPKTRACVSMPFPRAKPRAWAGRGAARNCFTRMRSSISKSTGIPALLKDGMKCSSECWRRRTSPKPLLTTYPKGFVPGEPLPPGNPYSINVSYFRENGTWNQFPAALKNPESLSHPVPARSLAGGFYFTLGQHCREVPYDPSIYFSDENSMAVRSFTHGYDLFHPHRHILWHHYSRESAPRHWLDHTEEARRAGAVQHFWWLREWRSVMQHQQLFGQADYGIAIRHGFGNQRSRGRFRKVRRFRLSGAQASCSHPCGCTASRSVRR